MAYWRETGLSAFGNHLSRGMIGPFHSHLTPLVQSSVPPAVSSAGSTWRRCSSRRGSRGKRRTGPRPDRRRPQRRAWWGWRRRCGRRWASPCDVAAGCCSRSACPSARHHGSLHSRRRIAFLFRILYTFCIPPGWNLVTFFPLLFLLQGCDVSRLLVQFKNVFSFVFSVFLSVNPLQFFKPREHVLWIWKSFACSMNQHITVVPLCPTQNIFCQKHTYRLQKRNLQQVEQKKFPQQIKLMGGLYYPADF